MKRFNNTPWVLLGAWGAAVLLLGLLLSTCESTGSGGSDPGRTSGAPGTTPGSEADPCSKSIGNQAELEAIAQDLSENYCLTDDITLKGIWEPLGTFTGMLDGKNYSIIDLTNDESTSGAGLFSYLREDAIVKNLTFMNPIVKGYSSGVLAGSSRATIENLKVEGGTFEGNSAGGLVGANSGVIKNSYVRGGRIRAFTYAGGLVGWNDGGTIENSYATGTVTSTRDYGYAGGLVGYAPGGAIESSYAIATVSGYVAGGLVGVNGATIKDSYATDTVTGTGIYGNVGGLVGTNPGTIENSYARVAISSSSDTTAVGGLAGSNLGTITSSHFDTKTTGQTTGIGEDNNSQTVQGFAAAPTQGAFVGWDFTTIWTFVAGEWPTLAWQTPTTP